MKEGVPHFDSEATDFWATYQAWLGEDRLNPKGSLGKTAEDHRIIGSSVPQVLQENPGKTLAELLTDEEITQTIYEEIDKLDQLRPLQDVFAQQLRESLLKALTGNIVYLTRINRVPPQFKKD